MLFCPNVFLTLPSHYDISCFISSIHFNFWTKYTQHCSQSMSEWALHTVSSSWLDRVSSLSVAGYLCAEHEKRRTRGGHRHSEGSPWRGGAADPLRDQREDITGLYSFPPLSLLCIYFLSLRLCCLTFLNSKPVFSEWKHSFHFDEKSQKSLRSSCGLHGRELTCRHLKWRVLWV